MDIVEFENHGFWIKTGKVWTHLMTGAQRHNPPNFDFHAALAWETESRRGQTTEKIRACDIEGVFILDSLSREASYNPPLYSVLIGLRDKWPAVYILDDNVIGALRSWCLVDPNKVEV